MPIGLLGQSKRNFTTHPDSVRELYYSETYNQLGFLNGREYKPYHNPSKTSPFLNSVLGFGKIYKDGVCYDGLTMAYDINLDELIVMPTEHLSENLFVQINKSQIDSFNIRFEQQSFNFFYLNLKFDLLTNGFYEIPYKGKYMLLIKHYTVGNMDNGILVYDHKKERYLIYEGQAFALNRKKALINLFEQNKKSIIKKFRSYHKPFKKLSNQELTFLVRYAESL